MAFSLIFYLKINKVLKAKALMDLKRKTLNIEELKYQQLLIEQLNWLNSNYYQVKNKSYKLYQLYNKGRLPENIKERCCNFRLLEEKCMEYNNSNKNN